MEETNSLFEQSVAESFVSSDAELVHQALSGRTVAYGKLVRRWSGKILALCHARTGHAHTAEDLAQETLLRGFLALGSLTDRRKFGPWLCGIATRVCLDWLKSPRRSQVSSSELDQHAAPAPSPAGREVDQVDRKDEVGLLLVEVERLPENYRQVLMLYYYGDHTYRELAEILGVSAATVNVRLTKARALLRRRLGGS